MKPRCAIESCGRPSRSLGHCSAHYARLRRRGDTDAAVPLRMKNAPGEGCITPDGYRAFTVAGVRIYEHRAVMEQILGRPLLPFENVHHRNGIRHDNRPENLELWTKKQPYGQRVDDLLDFVATHYAEQITARLNSNGIQP